jgi:hypothetical protein
MRCTYSTVSGRRNNRADLENAKKSSQHVATVADEINPTHSMKYNTTKHFTSHHSITKILVKVEK